MLFLIPAIPIPGEYFDKRHNLVFRYPSTLASSAEDTVQ